MNGIFLLCSGLGHIRRGFETFSVECVRALKDVPDFHIRLFSGRLSDPPDRTGLYVLRRNAPFTAWCARMLRKHPYTIEQITFAFEILPWIVAHRPALIYFSDGTVGNILWHFRRHTGLRYRLLLSNGAPFDPPFTRWDHVQHVAPTGHGKALACGESPARHTLLPYGVEMSPHGYELSDDERRDLRARLGLPPDRDIIICAAALNFSHKRLDYLLREFMDLRAPRPHLVLLGERGPETSKVERLAYQNFHPQDLVIRSVDPAEMPNYYRAGDAMVLPSISEGLARSLIEACSFGLPCIVHDYDVTRYVLGNHGYYGDLTLSGALEPIISRALESRSDRRLRDERRRDALKRFSWDVLRPKYVDLLNRALQPSLPPETHHAGH